VDSLLPLASIFITAFVVGLSGALMPGPLLVVTVTCSARHGTKGGLWAVAGHGLLEAVLVAILASGLGAFLRAEAVAGTIALAGGAWLAWMGVGIVRHGRCGDVTLTAVRSCAEGEARAAADARSAAWFEGLGGGIAASLSNPYWVLWWSTVGAAYVALALRQGLAAVPLFLGGHILADLGWYGAVAWAVARGRRLVRAEVYRRFLVALGLFVVILAIYFVITGVRLTLL